MRAHNQSDKFFVEVQLCGVEPEFAVRADELEQATEVECELVKEYNVERRQERSVDSGQSPLYTGAASPQGKTFEAGKCDRCRPCRALEYSIGDGCVKLDYQGFETRHARELCNEVRRVELG